MVEPTIVPRAEHAISRRDIDTDALKVLYRLHEHGHVAYLVGGSVRDLLVGRRPKDFDIGTSAHPYEIKKLFRNCWIIGRRFRLAHVKFGTKTIEVATFRRQLPDTPPAPDEAGAGTQDAERTGTPQPHHHHNTFGTPEEDAFRRDFTVNALFYDIGTFSIIDYVGGLRDLEARLVRSIGDPDVRFHEDPVRMLRAIVLASRLDLKLDPPVAASIRRNQALIATAAPARLLEEYYKILRSGVAERAVDALRESGLLRHVTPELHRASPALTDSLRALDAYRAGFGSAPETLTNAILMGTLLVPLGLLPRRQYRAQDGSTVGERRAALGMLPIPRRDVERLGQMVGAQRRLLDPNLPPRARRGLMSRPIFPEALTWLEIHGHAPDALAAWREGIAQDHGASAVLGDARPAGRRRRRRRRRRPRFPRPPE
jgi:poly(A) polymerase